MKLALTLALALLITPAAFSAKKVSKKSATAACKAEGVTGKKEIKACVKGKMGK